MRFGAWPILIAGFLDFTSANLAEAQFADAQLAEGESTVKAGQTVALNSYYAVNVDCSTAGKVTISMIHDPQFGKLEIKDVDGHPKFLSQNPRSICNISLVPGTRVLYHANPGFKGKDRVSYNVTFPRGHTYPVSLLIYVD